MNAKTQVQAALPKQAKIPTKQVALPSAGIFLSHLNNRREQWAAKHLPMYNPGN